MHRPAWSSLFTCLQGCPRGLNLSCRTALPQAPAASLPVLLRLAQCSALLPALPPAHAANTGHFVVLPTQASLAFVRAWNAVAPDMSGGTTSLTDQKTLPRLEGNAFMRCDTVCRCLRTSWNVSAAYSSLRAAVSGPSAHAAWSSCPKARPSRKCTTTRFRALPPRCLHLQLTRTQQREGMALFRTYLPGHYAYSPNRCTAGSPLWMPRLDPCDWHGEGQGSGWGWGQEQALASQTAQQPQRDFPCSVLTRRGNDPCPATAPACSAVPAPDLHR